MRLIFIRHGDPDYEKDNLTQKGKREVELLTKRVCSWKNITAFYQSPLGRAKATAAPSLAALGREATTCEWLKEFDAKTKMTKNYPEKNLIGKNVMCWDLLPEFFTSDKKFFDKDLWTSSRFMKSGKIKKYYKFVCTGIDDILSQYGYQRNNHNFYDVKNPVPNHNWNQPVEKYHLKSIKDDYNEETTLVFFCHLGVMFSIIAHLTGLSPMQLWQGFYVAPTSITILNSEERIKGQAWFRVERLGDTNHLTNGGEPISSSGYFASVLDESQIIK